MSQNVYGEDDFMVSIILTISCLLLGTYCGNPHYVIQLNINNLKLMPLFDICNIASGSDYAQLSEELWSFFHRVYGGGPEVILRSPCQRTGSNVGCNSSGSTSQTPVLLRTVPVAPESPLGMTQAHKACSTENITSHSGASGSPGVATLVHPTGRSQSISSDNITVRMAALSASGHIPLEKTDSQDIESGKRLYNIEQWLSDFSQ
jgi:hypothetical protein